ncbi:sensor domain-containing diguanylate cyclase [Parasphingopyxis marina]|uniref:diguanylate cyclase n=1 Tax=Parasphingopyxis marina TaxID=2761622 RepID=A0A842HZS3_9SPHN|nr:diguanylate cyclase [Parasphingopyxis marina]MBC2778057.1 diguanylate cyclase [Parasphingopyxis marina]
MRLATITNWAYGATVALTVVSGTTMLLASSAHEKERAAVEQRYRLDQATSRLDAEIYRLTDQAREYVITGDPVHLTVYRRHVDQLDEIQGRISHIEDAGALPDELDALAEGIGWADTLHDEQEAAIAAYQGGDSDTARGIMFGPEYERELARMDNMIERFQYRLDQRTANEVADAERAARLWRTISEIVVAITALLFFCVLFFVLRQRILRPVVRLSDVLTRLAAQDYEVEAPDYDQVDEIGDMAGAIRVFRENGLERQRLEREREADRAARDLLSRMIQRMQGCQTMADLNGIVERFAPQIIPSHAGRLYVLDGARRVMAESCSWLDPRHSGAEFPLNSCWALRRGVMHKPLGDDIDIACEHLGAADGEIVESICLPLTVQQETIGLLYLEAREPGSAQDDAAEIYINLLAENIASSLANFRLREALREMAMIDGLTGIPNRRSFDENLAELAGAAGRGDFPLSCLMLDVDHFKRFNDTHGHEAGDIVLREIGTVLANSTREDGMAFRYGGEEFALLMPDFGLDAANDRAEQIRAEIRALSLHQGDRALGAITVSIGLASAPELVPVDRLINAADAALYRAKESGRDRIVVATARDKKAAA